ncbi:hypothetical protein GCM10025865_04170 [Paraoerskovia sediminicola]|uniref:DUF11 domain-containing protein n=1 Tax=Paraoerskovia sediminicola TaxID=1138587 RepID=A0ABN6XA81_9CELL|nr:DUF11 domain-containing protein [Paraoerskovia sediminicola]BDZ41118.1 hypothetical protein GCM10025865_04170 [Paraoerskovia sediminicola]
MVGDFATVDITVAVPASITQDQVDLIVNEARVTTTTTDPDLTNNVATDESVFDTSADLVLDKSHDPDATFTAGETVEWTLDVSNDGPSDSQGPITVSDPLPAGVVSATADGGPEWTCSVSSDTPPVVSCVRATVLAAGADAPSITVVATIAPDAGPATLTNIASVRGTTNDPDLTNNDDRDDVLIVDQVDLGIVKTTTGDDPATAGGTTQFTIQVTNAGPSTADAVTVRDALPTGLVATAAAGTGWSCPIITPTVICTLDAPLDPGDAAELVVDVDVLAGVPDGTTLTNTAFVETSTTETGTLPNSDDADVDVVALADLAITKTHAADDVIIGEAFDFTVEVSNAGPSTATDVTMDDPLPAGLVPTAATGSGWTCAIAGQDVTCDLDDPLLPGADAAPITITAMVEVAAYPQVENVATVATTTPETALDDNTATDVVDVPELVDLEITKSHTGDLVVGGQVTYTVTVRNDGPTPDPGPVEILDSLPPGLEYVDVTSSSGSIDPSTDCAVSGAELVCTDTDGLAVGEEDVLLVTANVLPGAYPQVTNTAIVSTPTDQTDTTNDEATDTATVPALVNLVMGKSHEGDLAVGEEGTYTLTVTNEGPTPDPGPISVTDTLPDALAPISATSDGSDCTISGQTVTCLRTSALGIGDSFEVSVAVDVLPGAYPEVTNTAELSTPSAQTTTDDDVATDVAPVTPKVQLAIDKTLTDQGDLPDGTVDRQATWSIEVTNEGPNETVEPVVVTDDLPDGLELVDASGTGWACGDQAGDQGDAVECTYSGTLAVGAAAPPITVVTAITADPDVEVVNVATATGGGPGGEPVTAQDTVTAPPDPAPAPDADGSGSGSLPMTGSQALALVPWALALVLLGGVVVVGGLRARRRA